VRAHLEDARAHGGVAVEVLVCGGRVQQPALHQHAQAVPLILRNRDVQVAARHRVVSE
jgi:hypothetical protein